MRQFNVIVLLLLALLNISCDSDFDPFTASQNPPFFVITGTISNDDSVQVVRAETIRSTPQSAATINEFRVSSIEQPSGNTIQWRDSLVTFGEGAVGHLFTTSANFESGSTVTIKAVGEDERQAVEVSTTLPASPSYALANVISINGNVSQEVTLTAVSSEPRNVNVVYNVIPPETGVVTPIAVKYSAPPTTIDQQYAISVLYSRDYGIVLNELGRVAPDNQIRLASIVLDLDIVSPNWGEQPPSGKAVSYLASAIHDSFEWTLTSSQLVSIGYSGN